MRFRKVLLCILHVFEIRKCNNGNINFVIVIAYIGERIVIIVVIIQSIIFF